MICNKCNTKGILNSASGKDFWFCTLCRDEIVAEFKLPIINVLSMPVLGPSPMPHTSYTLPTPSKVSPFLSLIPKVQLQPNLQAILFSMHMPNMMRVAGPVTTLPTNPTSIFWTIPITAIGKLTLQDWIPANDPGPNDNFCGINRSTDRTLLSGIKYINNTGKSEDDVLEHVCREILYNAGNPDYCLVSSDTYRHINVHTKILAYGVTIIEDPTLSNNEAYIIQSNSWQDHSEYPSCRGNLVCLQPSYNAYIKLR